MVLCCATFPLIWVGGLVTTYDAGMAVPDWPNTYGYNLFLYPMSTWLSGPFDIFVEHGHRLLGATVGLITICLVAVFFKFETRSWAKALAVGCLLAVIAQGILGGLRVVLNEVAIARIHGITGPMFFGLTVLVAFVTSQSWKQRDESTPGVHKLAPWAWSLSGFTLLQLILGAFVRHPSIAMNPQTFRTIVLGHIVVAILLAGHAVVALVRRTFDRNWRLTRFLSRLLSFVSLLILGQIVLGISTWLVKYGWPTWLPEWELFAGYVVQEKSFLQASIVTAHVAIGSLILASAVALAAGSTRLLRQNELQQHHSAMEVFA